MASTPVDQEDGARAHLVAWIDLARSNLAPWPEVRRLHSNLLARTEAFLAAEDRGPVDQEAVEEAAAQILHDLDCSGDHPLSASPGHATKYRHQARALRRGGLLSPAQPELTRDEMEALERTAASFQGWNTPRREARESALRKLRAALSSVGR